ncbi:sporulation-delaying protein SdpB family protein [Streptomyces spiramenti]|uniref:sporulation-delaying protein SdpB family protein n=1 Tax=Streptomyces spiramenti TaxID=2720606 RepID=UPI00308413EB
MRTIPLPWTAVYGLARTLVALATLGTVLFSSTDSLFRPVSGIEESVSCGGVSGIGVFCLVPEDRLTAARLLCVAVLLVVASGWRPRWTALPHAWVTFSVWGNIAISDGGDQIATILALLLSLTALGDPRRFHWDRLPADRAETPVSRAVALGCLSALVVVRVQMSLLYFQACVAKLPHAEWADGTVMWYWATHPAFGAPGLLQPLVDPVIRNPLGVAALTWVPLAIELGLAVALLLPQRWRWRLLAAGVLFHFSIGLMMGLWSFSFAMWAGLVVLCCPLGAHLALRRSDTAPEPAAPGGPTRPHGRSDGDDDGSGEGDAAGEGDGSREGGGDAESRRRPAAGPAEPAEQPAASPAVPAPARAGD